MNLTNIISGLIVPLLTGLVVLARLSNPTADDAALTADIDGELKHLLRRKLSFVVDILWGITEFKTQLDAEIAKVVSSSNPGAASNLGVDAQGNPIQ